MRNMICAGLPDNAVSTFSYHILNFILIRDVEGNLPRVALRLAAGHCWVFLKQKILCLKYLGLVKADGERA